MLAICIKNLLGMGKDDLELLILLPPIPEGWDYRQAHVILPGCAVY